MNISYENVLFRIESLDIYYRGKKLNEALDRYRLGLVSAYWIRDVSQIVSLERIANHWNITVKNLTEMPTHEIELLYAQYIINHLIRILSEYDGREDESFKVYRCMNSIADFSFIHMR